MPIKSAGDRKHEFRMGVELEINGERLLQRLSAFSEIGATAAGGVNRAAFSVEDRQARSALAQLARNRGFGVYQDGATNLFIRRSGSDELAPPFLIGSHLDSQPTGGRFDGALGALAAFEVLETLEDTGYQTELPIEVVVWANEEGSRFAPGTMGSQAFASRRLPETIGSLHDAADLPLAAELAATLEALPEAGERPLGFPISGYLELHIEQGPILEMSGTAIGAVTSVQGTRWIEVKITGETGHSGTTPLLGRRDALAVLIEALARLYASIMPSDENARLTVGRIAVEPGSINAIPNVANCTLDIRHPSTTKLDAMETAVRTSFAAAADDVGCLLEIRRIFDMRSESFDEVLITCIEQSAEQLGLSVRRMVSGAFHDALSVAPLAPSAMIFVPCRGGISHNEKEFVEPQHCIAGAAVLLQTMLRAVARLVGSRFSTSTIENQKRMGT